MKALFLAYLALMCLGLAGGAIGVVYLLVISVSTTGWPASALLVIGAAACAAGSSCAAVGFAWELGDPL